MAKSFCRQLPLVAKQQLPLPGDYRLQRGFFMFLFHIHMWIY